MFLFLSGCKTIAIPNNPDPDPDPNPTENTFYVSLTGDDTNPGTLQLPWRNPGYASRQLVPGDTLIILGGTYSVSQYDSDIIIPNTGEAGKWITIKGETGNRPVIAGSNNLFSAVILSGVSFIRIENIEITSDSGDDFRDGINATDNPINNIVLKDIYIHHIDEYAVNMKDVSNITIENCDFSYCGFGGIGGPEGSVASSSRAVIGGWKDAVVKDCELSYSGHYYQGVIDNPANPYDRPDGIGLEESIGPVEIYNCNSTHNRGDGIDTKNENVYIHECVVSNNYGDGVKLWGDGSVVENTLIMGTGDGDVNSPWAPVVIDSIEKINAQFTLSNLTIHDNPLRRSYSIYVQYSVSVPVTVNMRNCIFSDCYGLAYFGDSVTVNANNNCFYCPNDDAQVYANSREYSTSQVNSGEFGSGNISGNPLFVNDEWGNDTFDYHLQNNSPCMDSGTGVSVPSKSLDNILRPQGSGFDMGVYEQSSVIDYVLVENVSQLTQAVEDANNGGNKKIRIANGIYTLGSQLWIGADNTDIRSLNGNPEDVIIQGDGMYGSVPMIFEVAAQHFYLEGVTVRRVANHAVQVHGELNAHYPHFKNVIFQDTYEQMLKGSYNLAQSTQKLNGGLVENCLFEYTAGIGPQYYIGGIDVHHGKDWIVRDCTFKNIKSPSDDLAEHAIHFWSDSEGTLVERNLILSCDRGIGFGLGNRGHIGGIIRNNMVYHDSSEGFADVGISLENSSDTQVYNNTVFMENSYPNAIEYRFPGTANAYLANNLTNKAILARDGAGGTVLSNFTSSISGYFADVSSGNLHLNSEVPGVADSGISIPELTDDYDGRSRPTGSGIDIGADEYNN